MNGNDEIVKCSNCGFEAPKDHLSRSCSNCFACTGCEIYVCPKCREEIVVKPMRPMGNRGVNGS